MTSKIQDLVQAKLEMLRKSLACRAHKQTDFSYYGTHTESELEKLYWEFANLSVILENSSELA